MVANLKYESERNSNVIDQEEEQITRLKKIIDLIERYILSTLHIHSYRTHFCLDVQWEYNVVRHCLQQTHMHCLQNCEMSLNMVAIKNSVTCD